MLNYARRRAERGADTLPQTAAEALFTVVGGRVAIVQILGEVTTAIQNQANSVKLQHDPATGTTTDICGALNIANDEVGTLYGISGLASDALIGTGQTVPGQVRMVILGPGEIELDATASNTGAVKWTMYYTPLDKGAYVTTA